jgi:hypothetical protein
MEGTVLQDDSLIPIKEKVYQYGKLKKGKERIVYKLRIDKNQTITMVIFSSNSDKLDYSISTDAQGENKLKIDKNKNNGRTISIIKTNPDYYNYIYLKVYQKDGNAVTDERLTNYVFKYVNAYDEKSIKTYKTEMGLEYSTQDNNIHILKIQKVTCDKCRVTYYVKFINRKHLVEGESFKNIAVIESKGEVLKYDNVSYQNDKVVLKAEDINFDFSNIQIIAHIAEESINEYIAYDSKPFDKNNPLFVALIIGGIIFFIIILVLIIIIIKACRKNTDLMDKVKDTSFKEEEEKREGIDMEILMDE